MSRKLMMFQLFIFLIPAISSPWARGAPLRPTMTRLSESLKVLIPLSGSPLSWEDPGNRSTIEKGLKLLKEESHRINNGSAGQNSLQDPALKLLLPYLTEEASVTLSAFKIGQYEYARKNIRNILTSCIACHSKEPELQEPLSPGGNGALKKLSAIERARYFSAIRDFDRSIEDYHRVLFEPGLAKSDLYTWERSFREVMVLLIRVKRNPVAAEALIQKLRGLNNIPYFLRHELSEWKRTLEPWAREKNPTASNESTAFLEIHRLHERASRKKAYPLDHSADAIYMRLSSLLFEFIRKYPQSSHLAEAWYLLGLAHQTLDVPPLDTLHEKFLEACVRKSPHTPLAQKCYNALEQSLFQGFTGSSGTHLPDEVMKKLIELWGLAFVPHVIQK
jgi:hypothetical protein